MKLIAEYLERAHQFERLAKRETDPKVKADFEKQALAYHKLAENLFLVRRLQSGAAVRKTLRGQNWSISD